jgi:hypothetical protein
MIFIKYVDCPVGKSKEVVRSQEMPLFVIASTPLRDEKVCSNLDEVLKNVFSKQTDSSAFLVLNATVYRLGRVFLSFINRG